MQQSSSRATTCLDVLAIVVVGVLVTACGGEGKPATSTAAQAPAAQARTTQAVPPQVKACSLFSKAEIETATGRTVRDPAEEIIANLSICSFGDPSSPLIAGRSLTKTVSLSVLSGGEGYYKGPVAQTTDTYEMAAKNAGEIQEVTGLGDKAHWAGSTLRVLRGAYMVEVEVDAGDASRKIAEQLARTAVERLPKTG